MNNRFVGLIAFVLATGLFFGYVKPAWDTTITDTKAAIVSERKALDAAKDYKERQSDLVAKRDAIDKKSLERLNSFLPDSVDNVGLILALNALAQRSGIVLSNVDVGAISTGNSGTAAAVGVSPSSSIDLSLSAQGSYPAFQRFLVDIERSQRLLDARSLSVSGSNSGIYTYQMTLRLYWLR